MIKDVLQIIFKIGYEMITIPKLSPKQYDNVSSDLEMDLIDIFKVMEQDILEMIDDGMTFNDINNEINKRLL